MHQVSTVFVRVPSDDWHAVKGGYKREIRSRQSSAGALQSLSPPTPCVAWRLHRQYGYDSVLMVLEAVWREPLGAISEESIANEGFATMAEFRRAWVMREKRRFPLLAPVTVHRCGPGRRTTRPRWATRCCGNCMASSCRTAARSR